MAILSQGGGWGPLPGGPNRRRARDFAEEQKMAKLHPQLKKDCLVIGRFPLCWLLLVQDANYPWFILVPDRDGVREIYELSADDQQQLMRESSRLASVLADLFEADKMNVAALGNAVPQLHLHHVVRYRDDPAWPGPIWGKLPAKPYGAEAIKEMTEQLKGALSGDVDFRV